MGIMTVKRFIIYLVFSTTKLRRLRNRIAVRYIFIGIGLVSLLLFSCLKIPLRYLPCSSLLWSVDIDHGFEGFDNVNGVQNGKFIVPNYVHFLRYGDNLKNLSFMDAVCILAAYKNQKPDAIYFHTEMTEFGGKYWRQLLNVPGFKNTIRFEYIKPLDSVFGQKLSSWYKLWHGSDILRIDILRRFGGIFLDNDVYLVQSLDDFRRYEMTLSIIDDHSFGTMTLIGHWDARFLKLWNEGYRTYYDHLWYYNAGEKPKLEILDYRPELVHNVPELFGVRDLRPKIYVQKWPDWRNQYTIHTLSRHLGNLDELRYNKINLTYPVLFNEQNIFEYNVTILEMVLDCCRELIRRSI